MNRVIIKSGKQYSSVHSFVRSSGQILLSRWLRNLHETYKEYSLAPTDDPIRFWRSNVKGQGHSRPSSWQRHPRRRWSVHRSPSSSL